MDDNEDTFNKYWKSLPNKPQSTLRFFERQEFYTVHYEDAEFLARQYYKSLEVVKYFKGSSNSPYVNISRNGSDAVFRFLLISNQYKVEIYTTRARDTNWSLAFEASPGNIENYQDILFPNSEISNANSLVAVNIKKVNDIYKVYLGYVDLDNGVFMLGQIDESCSELEQLSNLNAALFQLNCRECLVPAKDNRSEMAMVRKTVSTSGLVLSDVNKAVFETDKGIQSLIKLVSDSKVGGEAGLIKLAETEGQEALGCLCAVATYLSLGADGAFYGFFDVQPIRLGRFMRIGEACSRGLNILPDLGPELTKADSIYGLLNCCRTPVGERLLMQWLRQPLTDVNLINNRLDIVELMVNDSAIRSTLYDNSLRRIPDLHRIIKRIQRKKVNLQDMYKLFQSLKQVEDICRLFNDYEGEFKHILESEFTNDLKSVVEECINLTNMIESTLDFEAVKDQEFKIKPDIDENLQECNNSMEELKTKMEKEFIKICSELNMEPRKQVKFESSSHLGYYMRITRKEEKVLRDRRNIKIKETLKDGVKFLSLKMEDMNEEYKQLCNDYESFQKNIIDEMVKISGEYVRPVQRLSGIVARLDVLVSLAVVAISGCGSYVRPVMTDSGGRVRLRNCRHPLVEMQNVSYIANDVQLQDDRRFHIITGPNMGGKSTYIKSVGIAVVLAQIGSFVPCDAAEISVRDQVMTRIGAGDCQLKGVSTFMAEMLDISWILKDATSRSLIIIDELGRGTSTFDGFGLAWSISESLAVESGALCLFATHFHELTQLADKHPGVVANLHVAAHTEDDQLVFMYKVEPGAASKSYGVELGKAVGLPDEVIEMAQERLKEYEQDSKLDITEENFLRLRGAVKDFCLMDFTDVDSVEDVQTNLLRSTDF